eukprot:13026686-Alexandrium_andersonii.AAC.1
MGVERPTTPSGGTVDIDTSTADKDGTDAALGSATLGNTTALAPAGDSNDTGADTGGGDFEFETPPTESE